MTSADRRARTSRGGRPAPRAKCPSGRCAGCGRAGRRTGARRRGRFSRTAPRPSGSRPAAGHPARRPLPSASSTGVPARSAPSTVRRPVAPQRDGLPKAWRGSGRTANGMTGYAVEFHIPTEHFMSSLTKVSSTTRARHRAWIRRYARGVWRAAIEAGAYRTERFVALAMVQWPGPSIYPAMSCAETLKSEEPGELKGAERK